MDGNGFDDLLAAGVDGLISVHRSTGTGLAKAEFFHTASAIPWPVDVTDADGDGFGDLWALDDGGSVRHSVAPQVAGPTGTTGTDTSDTGTTSTSGGTGT